jgi:hypothetical protein
MIFNRKVEVIKIIFIKHIEALMASKTRATEIKRIRRDQRMGSQRKAALERNGTTLPAAVLFGDVKPAPSAKASQ